ncbi:group II intron reverse transcriptase/maturase, partial [Priestia megaterium]|nr:group II intron reverse transcriptase/maturase [Priestia megaterium]
MSPLLANIALCGMEEEIGIVYKKTYKPNGGYGIDPKCKIGRVLYADDFVIVTETKETAESMYEKLTPYLQKRGITLS